MTCLLIWFPSQCFVRLMELSQDEDGTDELWIYRDKNGIIKVIDLSDLGTVFFFFFFTKR